MYCGVELVYGQRAGHGSSICASGLLVSTKTAAAWSGGRHRDTSKKRERYILTVVGQDLMHALEPGWTERRERVRRVLEDVRSQPGTNPADIVDAAFRTAPQEMESLIEAMYELLSGRRGHGPSERRLKATATQLLLRTHHAAGLAITSTTRWPRTWGDTGDDASGNRVRETRSGRPARRPRMAGRGALLGRPAEPDRGLVADAQDPARRDAERPRRRLGNRAATRRELTPGLVQGGRTTRAARTPGTQRARTSHGRTTATPTGGGGGGGTE